ncbi:MAG: DUF1320 domain-containing protein [Alphaproteobacteria bacterium]|nr:DUF1320 domain-containing protein [Alphaproteobacteria bacterium]MDD9919776.1 DUF1320 domain-containing protein [Alphaproteobacteria bacterium]
MTYATQADLQDRYGENELISLTNPVGDTIDTTKVDRALADTKALIDAHLTKFQLPLNEVPSLLENLACNIARYYLYQHSEGAVVTDDVKDAFHQAEKLLNKINEEKISLGLTPTNQPTAPINEVRVTSVPPVLNQSTLEDY